MNATTPQLTDAPPGSPPPSRGAPRRPDCTSPSHPTLGEIFDERAPIVGAPAFFGPPIISVLGPWLLLVLLLIGPFALILTLVLALAVAAAVVIVLAMAIASPYLLIRHLSAHGVHTTSRTSLHLLGKHRASPRRLGSLQPKGMS